MRIATFAALAGTIVMAAAAAACGGDDADPTPTQPGALESPATATVTSPASSGGATTTPATQEVTRCTADDVALRATRLGAAAGTQFVAVSVENTSGEHCTLHGRPGVSLVDASRGVLGEPAAREDAVEPKSIRLGPGEAAHAMVGIPNYQNFEPGTCEGPSAELRVYLPDETKPLTAAFEDYACPGFSARAFEPEPGAEPASSRD